MARILKNVDIRRKRKSGCAKRDHDVDTETDYSSEPAATNSSAFRLSDISNLPTYTHHAASSLGVKYSSLVRRQEPCVDSEADTPHTQYDKTTDYNIFEDPTCGPTQLTHLPHPSQLFGKRLKKEDKSCRKEKIRPVDMHVSQLKRKRAKLDSEMSVINQSDRQTSINSQLDYSDTYTESGGTYTSHAKDNASLEENHTSLSYENHGYCFQPKKTPQFKFSRGKEE